MAEVNMIYYEKDYYAVPDAGAEKAYELLRQSLLSQKKVAIAKTVIGTNEKLLVLYPTKDGIIVKTLFYHDEIVAMPKPVPKMKLDENELAMAKMLIARQTDVFDDPDYIYELKMDGYRCPSYMDQNSIDLRNKRNIKMLSIPESNSFVDCHHLFGNYDIFYTGISFWKIFYTIF